MPENAEIDAVRDGRHLMPQDERRIEWFRARERPVFDASDVVHVRAGWIGRERAAVLIHPEQSNATRG